MRVALIVAVVLVSAAPSWAASKLKNYEKVLVCGPYGLGDLEVKTGDSGSMRIKLENAADLTRKELAVQLQGAGVTLVSLEDADAAVNKQQEAGVAKARGKVAPAAAAMGKAGGDAGDAARNAAMMNALKDPRLTPEMREQIRKSMAGSPSSGGTMEDMMASKMSGLIDQGKAAGAMRRNLRGDDPADGLAGLCPPMSMDEVVKDRERARFFELLESLGADAWLSVSAEVARDMSGQYAGIKISGSEKRWNWKYDAKLFDRNGKVAWKLKRRVEGEKFAPGQTATDAGTAIEAAVPDSVSKLIEKLTQ